MPRPVRLGLLKLIVAVLQVVTGVAQAQMSDLEFRPIGENRGVDGSIISSLLIDQRGYLWIGSRTGLYRYDGYEATPFKPAPDDPASISDLDIRALYEGADGSIWVATNTGGLNRLDIESGGFTVFRQLPDDPATLTHDSVYGMDEGPDGKLWAGTQIGLSKLDPETGVVTRYLNEPGSAESLPGNYVYTVYADSRGILWVATVGGGLGRYNSATDTFSTFDLAALTGGSGGENDVFAIAEDPDRNLWIGTRAGLLRMDDGRVEVERVALDSAAAAQPVVTSLLVGDEGQVWLGTMSMGLIRLDPTDGSSRAYSSYSATEAGGLSSQPILSLAMFRDMIFVGSWGAGVWAARLPDSDFRLHGTSLPSTGLRFKNITSILAGDTAGRPFVGSFGGGVQTLDVDDSTFSILPGDSGDHASAGVLSMARTRDGQLFAGTTTGLLELDENGGTVRVFSHDPSRANGIGEGYVTSLLTSADDMLWVGVGGSGLHLLDRAENAFTVHVHEPDDDTSLSGDYITTLLEEGTDFLWVGTRSHGLNLCRKSPWSCQRFSHEGPSAVRLGHYNISDLHRDSGGALWVASDGGGLHRVQKSGAGEIRGFQRWTEADGIVSNAIMAIESDSDGSLWLSTRNGLSRLDPNQGRITNFVEQSGLPASHFNAGVSGRDAKYLYFGSIDGVLTIPRGSPFHIRPAAPVRITAVEQIGREYLHRNTGWVPAVFTANYRDMLAIHFAALDYAEVPHQYEFRIKADDDWSSLGYRNEVTLLNLAPGDYEFRVRGRDVFGLWNTSEPLTIDVIPPYWMTTWFRLLVVASLLLIGYAAHRLRTRRLESMALEIERLGARREQALEEALGGKSELAGLTPRQKEVLQLIAEGCSTREIAERLNVSIKTVETHRAHLMDRLDIHDIAGLVRLAIRARLISAHD